MRWPGWTSTDPPVAVGNQAENDLTGARPEQLPTAVAFGNLGAPALMRPELSRSGMKRLALVGPFERLGHGAIEVSDESEHLVPQILDRAEVTAPQELADQNAQPDLDQVNANAID